MSSPDDRHVALHILKHLAESPDGVDTLEGIARFWVLRQEIRAHLSDVEIAVSGLLQGGFLVESSMLGNAREPIERYYQLNPEKLDLIKAMLQDADSKR